MLSSSITLLSALALVIASGLHGWYRARGVENLRSRPIYHGVNHSLWIALPMLTVSSLWLVTDNLVVKPAVLSELTHNSQLLMAEDIRSLDFRYLEITQLANGLILDHANNDATERAVIRYRSTKQTTDSIVLITLFIAGLVGLYQANRRFSHQLPAREQVERIVKILLAASSAVAVLTTFGIVMALLVETIRFFHHVPFLDFLLGTRWSPQMAIRADQVGSSGAFGALPLFAGTLLIALIAMLIAVPVGLYSAIYLAEYAQPGLRSVTKPALEILAGIPTVVYGFFAALTVAPMIVKLGATFGLSASSESALAAGLVMGVMIIPFVSSLSEDVISSVPQPLRDGSLAMGQPRLRPFARLSCHQHCQVLYRHYCWHFHVPLVKQ